MTDSPLSDDIERLLEAYQGLDDPVPGSEDHAELMEQLKADITGISGEDPVDQAFMAPVSPLIAIVQYYLAGFVVIAMATRFDEVSIALAGLLLILGMAILDGRPVGMAGLGTPRLTENLIYRKPGGRHLIVITASLAPIADQNVPIPLSRETVRLARLVSGVLTPVFVALSVWLTEGFTIAAYLALSASFIGTVMLHWSAIKGRFVPAGSLTTDAVACIALAQRLVARQPVDCEIQLVLSGGGWDCRSGWRTLLTDHRGDYDARPVTVIGFDGLGNGSLSLIREAGGGIPRSYRSSLADYTAKAAKKAGMDLKIIDRATSLYWLHPLTNKRFQFLVIGGEQEASSTANRLSSRSAQRLSEGVGLVEQAIRQKFDGKA